MHLSSNRHNAGYEFRSKARFFSKLLESSLNISAGEIAQARIGIRRADGELLDHLLKSKPGVVEDGQAN
jgi:hypothetical protein